MNTLLLIDGNAIMHRAFHALPPFKTKDGIPTNVIYGFFSMLHKSIADFHPNFIVVCFDTPKPTFRNKLFKEYQAQRPKISDDFITQIPLVKEALDKAGVTHLEKDGFEADDLIGTITKKFGLDPDKIPDLKALMGDPSDNYPGAKGIGPKGAAKLLQEFGSLDKIYSNLEKLDEKTRIILKKYKKQVSLAKKLAKIDQQVQIKFDINSARFEKFKDDLKNYFLQYEMKSLVNRFFSTISNAKEKSEKKKNNSQMGLF